MLEQGQSLTKYVFSIQDPTAAPPGGRGLAPRESSVRQS